MHRYFLQVFGESHVQVDTSHSVEPLQLKEPSTRKLSDMLTHELEPMSPLQVDFPDPKFGTGNDLNRTEEFSAHSQPKSADVSNSDPSAAGSIEMRQKNLKSRMLAGGSKGGSNVQYQEHDRGSWVNIKLVKGRNSAESALDGGGGVGELRPVETGGMVGSLDRVSWRGGEMVGSLESGMEKKPRKRW